ncbi:hypothetical protein J437_LFUL010262, partial [Ladona fulva]
MVYCSYPGCKNKCVKTYRFYRFPRDTQRRRLWAVSIDRSGWEPTETSRLCEDSKLFDYHRILKEDRSGSDLLEDLIGFLMEELVHFEESAFESHRADGLKKLKPNAVPTIRAVSGPVNRKRRKRKVKQRIEFTFGENDNESFVLAEKVPAESKERGTIQISEVYCNELDEMHKKPERRKRLKTLHVTEIVSNGLPLPIHDSGDKTEPIKLCSPFSSAENQDVQIKANKPKQGCPAKMRAKGREMEYNMNKSAGFVEHQSYETSQEVVDQ